MSETKEVLCKSFANRGKTRSQIGFESKPTSTGVKGIHYIPDTHRFKVQFEGVYIGRCSELDEAIEMQKEYLDSIGRDNDYSKAFDRKNQKPMRAF